MDFLDNLDDPNFNPFQTKTAILENFGTSVPVPGEPTPSASLAGEPAPSGGEPSSSAPKPPAKNPVAKKKFVPRKPLLKKSAKPAPAPETSGVDEPTKDGEGSSSPPPPSKGYNLDFLSQLDDPNFNPFETKTAVRGSFDVTTEPKESNETDVTNVDLKSNNSLTPESDKSEEIAKPAEKKKEVPKPWLKKKKKPVPKPASEPTESLEDPIPAPAKGYNLDFLDNMDDPNFNPFVTKTNVVDDVNKNNLTESSPAKLTKSPISKLKESLIKRESTVEFEMNENQIQDGVENLDTPEVDPKPSPDTTEVDLKPTPLTPGLDLKPTPDTPRVELNLAADLPDPESRLGSVVDENQINLPTPDETAGAEKMEEKEKSNPTPVAKSG